MTIKANISILCSPLQRYSVEYETRYPNYCLRSALYPHSLLTLNTVIIAFRHCMSRRILQPNAGSSVTSEIADASVVVVIVVVVKTICLANYLPTTTQSM